MDGQELIERRFNYGEERKRMDDRILDKLMELGEKVSSMDSTLQAQIKTIEKYNNLSQRILSLEEYRARQIAVCDRIQAKKEHEEEAKKFPWKGVAVGLIVSAGSILIGLLINHFVV